MDYFTIFKNVLFSESAAIDNACKKITKEQIDKLVEIFKSIKQSSGNIVCTGVGKSGVIATKLSSTLTSLGMPSYFLHPVEALHGDLGRHTKSDALIMISNSGTTEEIIKLLPFLPMKKENIIGIIGNPNSRLAHESALFFDAHVEKEASINNLAPTTSTTVALAICDAISVIYETYIGLSKEEFAINHPGGLLGKMMTLKVTDIMIPFEECPRINENQTLKDAILEMTNRPSGMCAVLDKNKKLLGIVVEGDIRRAFFRDTNAISSPITKVMNPTPVKISSKELAITARNLMNNKNRQINIMPVLDGDVFVGEIRLQDLIKQGFSF